MKKTMLAITIGFCTLTSSNVFAESKSTFCSKRNSSNKIQKQVANSDNFLAFRNQGGLINGGVCWWHSRFQRNAMVVARFRPELSEPTEKEVKKIIKAIRKGKSVVEIGGYYNIRDFSYDHADLIQRELEKWQKGDGFLRQQWAVGLWGSSEVDEEELKERMDDLYTYVKKEGNIAYQMLQIKGIDSHAWLVFDMEKTSSGYDILVLDSNYQRSQVYHYDEGMTSFHHSYYGDFVPYTGKKSEFRKALKAVEKYCN
ncbi:hypothetical protein BIY24_02025 [Halobacteriovorax marinus]|uniref:hypothetical protein n=1 Tax=Halobacteriovorax marinus TaxID=97084 RepID=UPI000BC3382C|nr:hypothetical protein [Halobacteriovorax marinus]ATH06759.1 hypothetical protein BIY24_02025 [Halobacteriovorax marinus]